MECGDKNLAKLYECDKAAGAFIISIALEKYSDVFNELDSAPWSRKDIDIDFRVFLEESSSDIPLKRDIILRFTVAGEKQDESKEDLVKQGLRNYFLFVRHSMRKQMAKVYQRSIVYALAGFALLFASYSLQTAAQYTAFTVLVDVILIGGWIFLWEAFSTYIFQGKEQREKLGHYERLSTAPIQFLYKENTSPKINL